jgi:hypothetical protein
VRDDAPPLDPCGPNPCVQPGRGQCSNVEGKAVCACDSGKVEDGSGQCVPTGACMPNPCTAPHKTDCAVVEGRPVCACVSGYVPEGEACVPSGPDDHGNTPSESSPVIIDAPPTGGSFEQAEDVDLFSFQAQTGHLYAFTCNPGGGAVDCQVSLSDAAGQVLAVDNNGGTGFIVYEYTTAGTYYFRVSSGQVGPYTYRLEDLGFDDHGDIRATATASTPGASATPARLEVPGDVDFLKFGVGAGLTYSFTCTSTAFACTVELQDAAGTVLASGTASADTVTLPYTASTEGTLYVRLAADSASAMGAYSWRLQAASGDDHGDTPSEATPVTPSSTSIGAAIHATSDVDVFSFEAAAGHIYEISCNTSAFDCDLVLLNALGAVVIGDTYDTTYARVRVELNTPGSYYFRIQPGDSTIGAYTYRLQDLGVDDHGDTLATATPITPGTSWVPAQFEVTKDEDWFSFTATAGHLYDFTCSTASIDCHVYLTDAEGKVVVADTSSTSNPRVRWEFTTGGTFYIRVVATGGWNVSYTSYTYRLQDLGVDDHADTFPGATVLTLGTATSGNLEFPGDVDFFEVNLAASTASTVTTTGLSTTLTVYAPDKTTVISTGSSPRAFTSNAAGGAHYVRVSGSSTGAYTVKVQ